jgi:hypothetical protein
MRNHAPLLLAFLLLAAFSACAAAVGSSTVAINSNVPALLSAGNDSAMVIVYGANASGADAAFISHITLVRDGGKLPSGDNISVSFDDAGLRQVRAGGVPSRDGWVDISVTGLAGNHTQRVYSSASGYEATFTPSVPLSASGARVAIEYANQYWFIGDMDAQNRSILLYQEDSYGRIGSGRNLTSGPYGLEFLGYQGGQAIVKFRAGNEPTFFAVQQLNDPLQKRLILWVDYNSSAGPIASADCYLQGELRGSLALLNGRYKGQLDYASLPVRNYSYAISCSREGYEPKLLALSLDTTPQAANAPSPSGDVNAPPPVPTQTQISAPVRPYNISPRQKNLFEVLDEFLHNPFGLLG